MYDELVKQLRDKAGAFDYDGRPDIACDYEQAADAIEEIATNYDAATDIMKHQTEYIEELSRRETPMKITEIHVDEYYCPACGAENNCDQGYVQDAYCPVCGQHLLAEEGEI